MEATFSGCSATCALGGHDPAHGPLSPRATQQKVLGEIIDRSERVVVMTKKGEELLGELYGVPAAKIDLIPHGIHDVPFTDPNACKAKFGVQGKLILLTFGLLGRSKGIESVIRALPEVIERFPEVVFLVVGATHPNVIRQEGESYRLSLQGLARELRVEKNVAFYNRFVDLNELMEFLSAADIYVTPYLNQDQITSGTLAYALGRQGGHLDPLLACRRIALRRVRHSGSFCRPRRLGPRHPAPVGR